MPAVAPYIPVRDSQFNLWMQNFATLTSATPALYGLTSADALNIANAIASWTAAYTPVTSPMTRTATVVGLKNSQKVSVQAIIRPYAQQIAFNQGVASGDKIALGLNPKTSLPSPITPPTSNPLLLVQSAGSLSLILRYRDSAASVSVKGKPYGVTQLRLFGKTSATPISDPTLLPFLVSATKSPFVLSLTPFTPGQQLYLAGQWAVRTGGVSPWSPIINFTVPIGG